MWLRVGARPHLAHAHRLGTLALSPCPALLSRGYIRSHGSSPSTVWEEWYHDLESISVSCVPRLSKSSSILAVLGLAQTLLFEVVFAFKQSLDLHTTHFQRLSLHVCTSLHRQIFVSYSTAVNGLDSSYCPTKPDLIKIILRWSVDNVVRRCWPLNVIKMCW